MNCFEEYQHPLVRIFDSKKPIWLLNLLKTKHVMFVMHDSLLNFQVKIEKNYFVTDV